VIGLDDVRKARETLRGRIVRTPLLPSEPLSETIGAEAWLKLESLQKTGSFKVRGALNAILSLPEAERAKGVLTISAGNHAQGVAYAARAVGVPATVVMAKGANPAKVAATNALGAEVVFAPDIAAAFETLERLRRERGLVVVHAFDDDRVIAGQGTVALEILEDVPDLDLLVIPVGGGGLLAGCAVAAKAARPEIRIAGVEPTGADKLRRAREAKRVVRLERMDTIADGLAPPFVGERNLEIALRHEDEHLLVTDDEIRSALRFLMEKCQVLAEPSGAASVAALLAKKLPVKPGSKVAAVVSGGNVDPGQFAALTT